MRRDDVISEDSHVTRLLTPEELREREYADRDKWFKSEFLPGTDISLAYCRGCGSVVYAERAHIDFHLGMR